MLMREDILRLRSENAATGGDSSIEELCAMALALLDIADLVPGEGDVVERVRHSLAGAHHEVIRNLTEQLRRAEAELSEARKAHGIASYEMMAAQRDRAEAAVKSLYAKLAALADAWARHQRGDLSRDEFEGTIAELAELAEARKVLP